MLTRQSILATFIVEEEGGAESSSALLWVLVLSKHRREASDLSTLPQTQEVGADSFWFL